LEGAKTPAVLHILSRNRGVEESPIDAAPTVSEYRVQEDHPVKG